MIFAYFPSLEIPTLLFYGHGQQPHGLSFQPQKDGCDAAAAAAAASAEKSPVSLNLKSAGQKLFICSQLVIRRATL